MNDSSFIILLYHGVDSGEEVYKGMEPRLKEYILGKELFESHIGYLYKNGYKVLLLSECLDRANRGTIPEKTVVLTFDDGEKSCHKTIAPILNRHNFKGEFFVISRFVGKKDYMTDEEIRDLSERGHGIQSHSASHPFLSEHGDDKIFDELKSSKCEIATVINRQVNFFSIPTGSYDKRVIDAARAAGYKAVLSSVEGYNSICRTPFFLKRFAMRSYTDTKTLAGICENKTLTECRIFSKRLITEPLKFILTFKIYNKIRERVISGVIE